MEKANYAVKDLELARRTEGAGRRGRRDRPGAEDRSPAAGARGPRRVPRAGRPGALFMADPLPGRRLAKYLAKYGVALGNDLVVEPNPIGQLFGVGPEVPIVTRYEQHPITKDMSERHDGSSLVTRSVAPAEEPPRGLARRRWPRRVATRGARPTWPGLRRGQPPAQKDPRGYAGAGARADRGHASSWRRAKPSPAMPKAEGDAAEEARGPPGRPRAPSTFASNQCLGSPGQPRLFLNIVVLARRAGGRDRHPSARTRARTRSSSPAAQSRSVLLALHPRAAGRRDGVRDLAGLSASPPHQIAARR